MLSGIVVDEANWIEAKTIIGSKLLDHQFRGVARANDENAFAQFFPSSVTPGPRSQRPRKKARKSDSSCCEKPVDEHHREWYSGRREVDGGEQPEPDNRRQTCTYQTRD